MSERAQSQEAPTKVECPAAKDPAVRLFILAGMLLAIGTWCFVDGYVRHKFPWNPDGTINEKLNYLFNHVGGIAFPILALVPLIWGVVVLRRRLVADEEGIGYVGKEKVPWSAVTSLGTAKLADKGILHLHYKAAEGTKRLVLDKWKLQNFRELVELVEAKTPQGAGE